MVMVAAMMIVVVIGEIELACQCPSGRQGVSEGKLVCSIDRLGEAPATNQEQDEGQPDQKCCSTSHGHGGEEVRNWQENGERVEFMGKRCASFQERDEERPS